MFTLDGHDVTNMAEEKIWLSYNHETQVREVGD